MVIEDCAGINLTSSIISCSVKVEGSAANRIAGNYIIPGEHAFEFCESTCLQSNYTADGSWVLNRQ